jgi:hypothetical protein
MTGVLPTAYSRPAFQQNDSSPLLLAAEPAVKMASIRPNFEGAEFGRAIFQASCGFITEM